MSFQTWRTEYSSHLQNLQTLFKSDDRKAFLDGLRYPDDVDLARLFARANKPPRTSYNWLPPLSSISLDKWRFLLELDANPNLPIPAPHAASNFPLRDHSAGTSALALAVEWNILEAVQFLVEEAGADLISVHERDGLSKYHRISNMELVRWCRMQEERRSKASQDGSQEALQHHLESSKQGGGAYVKASKDGVITHGTVGDSSFPAKDVRSFDEEDPDRSQMLEYLEKAVERQRSGELSVHKLRFPRLVSQIWQDSADDSGKENPVEALHRLEHAHALELEAWRGRVSSLKARLN